MKRIVDQTLRWRAGAKGAAAAVWLDKRSSRTVSFYRHGPTRSLQRLLDMAIRINKYKAHEPQTLNRGVHFEMRSVITGG